MIPEFSRPRVFTHSSKDYSFSLTVNDDLITKAVAVKNAITSFFISVAGLKVTDENSKKMDFQLFGSTVASIFTNGFIPHSDYDFRIFMDKSPALYGDEEGLESGSSPSGIVKFLKRMIAITGPIFAIPNLFGKDDLSESECYNSSDKIIVKVTNLIDFVGGVDKVVLKVDFLNLFKDEIISCDISYFAVYGDHLKDKEFDFGHNFGELTFTRSGKVLLGENNPAIYIKYLVGVIHEEPQPMMKIFAEALKFSRSLESLVKFEGLIYRLKKTIDKNIKIIDIVNYVDGTKDSESETAHRCGACVFTNEEEEDEDLTFLNNNGFLLECNHSLCFCCILKMKHLYQDCRSHSDACPLCRKTISIKSYPKPTFDEDFAIKFRSVSPHWIFSFSKVKAVVDTVQLTTTDFRCCDGIGDMVEIPEKSFLTRMSKKLGFNDRGYGRDGGGPAGSGLARVSGSYRNRWGQSIGPGWRYNS